MKIHPYFKTRRFSYPKRWIQAFCIPDLIPEEMADWADAVCYGPGQRMANSDTWRRMPFIKVAYLFPTGVVRRTSPELDPQNFTDRMYGLAEPYIWRIDGEIFSLGKTHFISPRYVDTWPKDYADFLIREGIRDDFDALFLDWFGPVYLQTCLMDLGLSISEAVSYRDDYSRMLTELAVILHRRIDLPIISNGYWHEHAQRGTFFGKMFEGVPQWGSYFYSLFGRDRPGMVGESANPSWSAHPPMHVLYSQTHREPDNAHLALSMILGVWYAPRLKPGEVYEFAQSTDWIPANNAVWSAMIQGGVPTFSIKRRFHQFNTGKAGLAEVTLDSSWENIISWHLPWD